MEGRLFYEGYDEDGNVITTLSIDVPDINNPPIDDIEDMIFMRRRDNKLVVSYDLVNSGEIEYADSPVNLSGETSNPADDKIE